MRGSFRNKDLLSICIYSVLITLLIFLVYTFKSVEYPQLFKLLFWILLAHIISTFFCFKLIGIRLFSISGFFITLSYVFHFGQVLVKGISSTYEFSFDVSSFISQEVYMESILFSLTIISLVSLGMMIAKLQGKNNKGAEKKIHIISMSSRSILVIGWILFLVTFPFEFYYSFSELMIARQLGYGGVLEVESSGILSQFARFHLIGIGLLIMGYSHRPVKSIFVLSMYSVYSVIFMLSGSRIYQVLSILVLTFIMFKSTKIKFSLKTCLVLSLPTFFFIVLLNTIAEIRLEGFSSINDFVDVYKFNLINNPFLDILEEFGGTIYTLCLTVIKVPSMVDYSHGLQFITGFLTVLPNINGIFTEINQTTIFSNYLNTRAIGGSYIAELYYSFKYTSFIATLLIGYLIQLFSYYFEYHLERKDFMKAAYFILPTFALLLWVRGYYVGILRNSIWATIFIYFIQTFLTMNLLKKNKVG